MILKYLSEKLLTKAIYWLTFILALTPGIYINSVIYPYVTAKIIAFRIIMALIIFLYITLILKNKEYLPSKNKLLFSFFVFVFVCFISGQFSFDRTQSFWSTAERMMGTFNYIHFFLFTLIVSSVFKTKEIWHKMLNLWNWLIVITGTISLFTFVSNHLIAHTSIFSDRFYGFAGNPIFFSAVILVFFYINLYLFFEKLGNHKNNWQLIWHLMIALMYLLFIILTGSRGAFVALAVTGFILLISLILNPNHELTYWLKIDTQKISLIILISILIITGSIFAFKNTSFINNNYILRRLTSLNLNDGASLSRIVVAKIGLNCFFQKPILGYGFDNFEICYQRNFDKMIAQVLPKETRFDKTHNMPIEILATTGVVGFIFYMGMYFYGYKNIKDLMISEKINFYSGLSIILALVTYFIQNLFVFDVFEGWLANCLLFALIISLNQDKIININIDKLSDINKNIIIIISGILLCLNVYWLNIYIFYYNGLPRRIDNLVANNKTDIALDVIKNSKNIKSPYIDALYYGFFDTFIKNQKQITQQQLENYYKYSFTNQEIFYNKYPYRARIYLSQLAHIASKAVNHEININDEDIKSTRYIVNTFKQHGLLQPEVDFFYLQILLNSQNPKDWVEGEEKAKEFIKFYSESGKFYWVYAVHLLEDQKRPKEGIEYLKKSLEKDIVFESIDQLLTTIIHFNQNNEPDLAIQLLKKYLPSNPTRFQLYMELARAYILKQDYVNAKESLNQANQVYISQRLTKYSSKIEGELKNLEEKLNKIKPN